MDKLKFSNIIKAEANSLGFFACGIAEAKPVDDTTSRAYVEWIENGCNAEMEYLRNNVAKRLNPCLLMPGVKSIVSVALNYTPANRINANEPQIAAYALGKDYHDVMKTKLHLLASKLGFEADEYRAFCDTAPVLERYWAVRGGLGWIGKNHQLIIPKAGSMFFLGELFLPIELSYDEPNTNYCGNCRKCVDACPTHSLRMNLGCVIQKEGIVNNYDTLFDSNLCINYQTIENRGDISEEVKPYLGNSIYGCDCCQNACPWNRFATPTLDEDLFPSEDLLNMTRDKWLNLSEEDYRRLFKGSAVKRAKYTGLMRNIHNALDK